jgi:hypothetical protein
MQISIEVQSGDDAKAAADRREEVDSAEHRIAGEDDAATVDLQQPAPVMAGTHSRRRKRWRTFRDFARISPTLDRAYEIFRNEPSSASRPHGGWKATFR